METVADSAVSGAALRALENHAGRPEVKAALAGEFKIDAHAIAAKLVGDDA
mgnify:CR=1 FL=1